MRKISTVVFCVCLAALMGCSVDPEVGTTPRVDMDAGDTGTTDAGMTDTGGSDTGGSDTGTDTMPPVTDGGMDSSMSDGSMGDGSMGDGSMGDGSMGDGSMGDGSMGDGSMGDGSMMDTMEPRPDYANMDSDGDTISDLHEGAEFNLDTDFDGTPDYLDDDSDNDGVPDVDEVDDADILTPPGDADMDRIPNYRDTDSDDDGVADADEITGMTDPWNPDSDGDGATDLVESAAGTDPLDPASNPRALGDFVFLVPYEAPPEPPRDTLEFSTTIAFADAYFLFDTTGSMTNEIAAMRSAIQTVVANLSCEDFGTPCTAGRDCAPGQACGLSGTCIENPAMSECIQSLWTGVGTYEGDRNTYRNRLSIQSDPAVTSMRIPTAADGRGGDESLFESVACVGNPTRCNHGGTCASMGIGCPGYRADSVPILVVITDEKNECKPDSGPFGIIDNGDCSIDTAAESAPHLNAAGITFVGIDADAGHEPRGHLRQLAEMTMSVRSDGELHVYEGDGAAVSSAVTTAINEIANGRPIRVTIEVADVDAGATGFIDYLETNTSGAGACTNVTPLEDTDGDGRNDAFPMLTSGTPICWDVVAEMNTTVAPTEEFQIFRATATVLGDGTPLDRRTIYFLVPPDIPQAGLE